MFRQRSQKFRRVLVALGHSSFSRIFANKPKGGQYCVRNSDIAQVSERGGYWKKCAYPRTYYAVNTLHSRITNPAIAALIYFLLVRSRLAYDAVNSDEGICGLRWSGPILPPPE